VVCVNKYATRSMAACSGSFASCDNPGIEKGYIVQAAEKDDCLRYERNWPESSSMNIDYLWLKRQGRFINRKGCGLKQPFLFERESMS